ncbi:MAG: 50S ribosomal protein L10 [Patescibacteria group bacterium]
MAKTKTQKQEILKRIGEHITSYTALTFVDFKGLKVKEIGELRKQLKQNKAKLMVTKKTLLSKALKEKGMDIDVNGLEGQMAVIFAFGEPIPSMKTIATFAKAHEHLKILGGYFEDTLQTLQDIIAMARLPSKEELRAMLGGTIKAPLSGFLNVLEGNMKGLISVLAQHAKA